MAAGLFLFLRHLNFNSLVDATAIEYGPIAAGIALAIIGIVDDFETKLNAKFTSLNNSLK
jgi:pilus assembly protein Flp/PilA